MHDGLGRGAPQYVVQRNLQFLDAGLFDLVDVARGNPTALLNDDLAVLILNVERSNFTTQTLRHQLQAQAIALDLEDVGGIEGVEDFLSAVSQGAQKHRGRQLAATVDTHEHSVLGVKLEVQPGAAVGNNACGIQQLARAVSLAAVVVEEHAWRTVQLGNDDTLGTVDDKGTVFGHQGDFPHVNFLLLDVLDRFIRRLFVENDQAQLYPQRDGKGYAAQHAFFDIKGRLTQAIAYVFQSSAAGIADDRENGFEGRMKANVAELVFAC